MVGRYELSDLSSGSSDVESGFLLDEDVYCQQIGSQEGAATSSTPRRRAYVQSQYDRNTSNENGMLADHHHQYEKLYYRPILPKDRLRIQELHEEWFPVAYQEEFYDNLVHGKMFQTNDPLYTNLVCDEDDDIKACIVGMFVKGGILNHASRQLLLPDWPSRHDNVFYIMTLGTVPEFRHEGLATSLIAELEQIVKEDQGCGAMYLHVITSNKAAIRFYERLKFWRVQEIENYYTIDDEQYNCYLYARYFHGNRGHLGIVKLLSWWISSLWHRFRDPLYYYMIQTRKEES